MTVAAPPGGAAGEQRAALRKQLRQLKKLRESDAGVPAQIKALKKQLKALGAADPEATATATAAGGAAAGGGPARSEATVAGGSGGGGGGDEAASGGGKKGKKARREGGGREAEGGAGGKAAAKREKKAKRKRAAEASAAAAVAEDPAPAAAPAAAAPRPAKKAKKEARRAAGAGGAAAAPPPTALAAVGDRALAASRPPVVKALYRQQPEVAGMARGAVAAWREERRIALSAERCHSSGGGGGGAAGAASGGDAGADPVLNPLLSFQQSGLSAAELHATAGFAAPSPIQARARGRARGVAQCLPIALAGRDLVGIAATGSGKTLAFGLPALRHVRAQVEAGVASGRKPVALVLAPTRELALQISGVLESAGGRCGVAALCVYGGVPKREQAAALRK
eukprot:scaffold2.g6918.t1